jgi:type IV pilus assembly protein PilC
MKQFTYKAREKSGNPVTGTIESVSESAAAKTLQSRGLFVLSIVEKRQFSLGGFFKKLNGVSEQDVAVFTRLLATMLSTGLPLTDALTDLTMQFRAPYFREIIQSLLRDVQSGTSLSEAMTRFPLVFNNLYINLMKAGEASGKVDEALQRLAETLEEQLDFKAKIKGAMTYPVIVTTATLAISIFMLTTIIPKIASVYKDYGSSLPLPTRVLIGFSDILTNYWWLWIGVIGLIVFFFRTIRKNPVGEYSTNNLLLRMPVFGKMNEEVAYTILCKTLGTLIASGVAILDAIKIVAAIMDNNYIRGGLISASRAVEKGLPFSLALKRDGTFPQMMVQLVAIGEETGTLDQSFLRVAKFYQDSAERRVKTLTTALEPFLLLLMGVMVGGLAIAVLLPMFNLVNVVK